MVRALGVMVITGMLLGASSANAQSLGEAAAATGIHQTLAGTGMGNPAGTIGTVKRAVGAAAATKQGQLDGAAGGVGPVGWGGKGGGRSGWTAAAGGWKGGGGAGKGWTAASTGWAGGGKGASGAWAPGGGWASARAVN